jgi:hypothetical protein
LEEGAFDAKEMSRMYDEELLIRIRDSNVRRASAMVERLMIRRLFKRAYYKKIDSDIDVMGLQSAIEKAGFGRERFIVHVRSLGGAEDDVDVIGMDGNSVGKLSEISPFMQTLIGVLQNSRMLLVACDKKDISGIERVVVKFLK